MSAKILEKQQLSENVYKMVLDGPKIARKRKAGQFIVLRIHEEGERIPLTIADADVGEGSITIIFQRVGQTARVERGHIEPRSMVAHLGEQVPAGELQPHVQVLAGPAVADGVRHGLFERQDNVVDRVSLDPVLGQVVADTLAGAQQTRRIQRQLRIMYLLPKQGRMHIGR